MKHNPTLLSLVFYSLWTATLLPGQSLPTASSPSTARSEEDEVVRLSPFVVSEDSSIGYRATSTLAGSRLRTPLRDVGSAIQVITSEFLEDTGATSAAELLSYTLNTEVGGAQGNFAGGGFDSSGNRTDQNGARINPESNQRIRGLGAATLTRDFFLTNIPFDSYNSSQVTINRGPNSILFGVGDPSGIIENSLNKASLAKSFGSVSARYGRNDSFRSAIDLNQVLIDERLAVRVAGLYEQQNFNQKPAYERDRRVYAAMEGVLFKNEKSSFLDRTVLRASFEQGELKSNPPMVIPPRSSFHAWWAPSTTNFAQYSGVTPPANHTTNHVSQYTVSLTKTPSGITTANTPNVAWTTIFDQGTLIFPQPGATVPNAATATFPGAQGLQGRLTLRPGNIRYEYFSTQAPEGENYGVGFVLPTIQDRSVFDYRKNSFAGNTSLVDRDFKTYNVALEQLFFRDRRAGIEVAFDKQEWTPSWRMPVDDSLISVYSNADVAIDISERLGTGDPNPNLGRPFVRLFDFGGYRTQRIDRDAARATAFYELDFAKTFNDGWAKWLGKHTLTGFWGTQRATNEFRNFRATWDSDAINWATQGWGNPQTGFFRTVTSLVYLGPSALTASGPGGVRLSPVDVAVPNNGDVYNIWYQGATGKSGFDAVIRSNDFRVSVVPFTGNKTRNKIDSQAFTIQSRFFNDHIVALAGWRKDEASSFERLTTEQLLALTGTASRSDSNGIFKEENYILQGAPTSVEEGRTFTGSVVAHIPTKYTSFLPFNPALSLHYGQSENFSPAGLRRSVYLDLLAPPVGDTKEYGVSVDLGKKHFIRFNWFESKSAGADSGFNASLITSRTQYRLDRMVVEPLNAGWTFAQNKAAMLVGVTGPDPIPGITSYAQLEDTIRRLIPDEIMSQLDYRVTQVNGTYRVESNTFGGQVATAAVQAKGFEIDLVSNPTPNWRLMFNVAKQETVQSDSAADAKRLADTIQANLDQSGLSNLRVSPTFNAPETVFGEWNRIVLVPLNGILARDGTISLEQRKWRANFVSTYRFSRNSFLKGVEIGGGVRWQDKVGIGYGQLYSPQTGITPDLSKPYFAPAEWNGDVWCSYRRKLTEKINWKVQLNVRNAFGDDTDIPVKANPDGSIAVIRIPNETTWFLTNTFEF